MVRNIFIFFFVCLVSQNVFAGNPKLTLNTQVNYVCSEKVFHETWVALVRGHGLRKNDFATLSESCERIQDTEENSISLQNKIIVSASTGKLQLLVDEIGKIRSKNEKQFLLYLACKYSPAIIYEQGLKIKNYTCNYAELSDLSVEDQQASFELNYLIGRELLEKRCGSLRLQQIQSIEEHLVRALPGNRVEYFAAAAAGYLPLASEGFEGALLLLEEAVIRGDVPSIAALTTVYLYPNSPTYSLKKARNVLCNSNNKLGPELFNSNPDISEPC